jgi:hypothetical protein
MSAPPALEREAIFHVSFAPDQQAAVLLTSDYQLHDVQSSSVRCHRGERALHSALDVREDEFEGKVLGVPVVLPLPGSVKVVRFTPRNGPRGGVLAFPLAQQPRKGRPRAGRFRPEGPAARGVRHGVLGLGNRRSTALQPMPWL